MSKAKKLTTNETLILSALRSTWQYIASDAMAAGVSTNAEAREMVADANRPDKYLKENEVLDVWNKMSTAQQDKLLEHLAPFER